MKKVVLSLIILFLGACSFRSPQSEFYVMNSNGLSALSDKDLNVAVARVKVPDMLDKSQMVIYDKDTAEVQILEFQRWAEVLPEVLQTTLTNDLIAYLPNAYVKRTYFDNNSEYSVNVEINQIKAYKGDRVELSAWWNIKNKNGKIVKRKQGMYVVKVDGSDISDLVNAEAHAVHQMSREIAEALVGLK